MSQKFRGIQCPIVVLGETCKWGGSMKAVWQDSACDISLVRLMYSVMPHPSLKESHLQEHENHVGEPSTIQASSSKRVKISKALSTLIPGRSSKTCLRGVQVLNSQSMNCLIKGVAWSKELILAGFWLMDVQMFGWPIKYIFSQCCRSIIPKLVTYITLINMQYVLEAHREFIRSKLSSNQSRNLNMIVKHKKHTTPWDSECSSFHLNAQPKKNKKNRWLRLHLFNFCL